MEKKKKFPVPVAKCDHGTDVNPKFATISENAEGKSLMQCRKCGLEKSVTVRRVDEPQFSRKQRKHHA